MNSAPDFLLVKFNETTPLKVNFSKVKKAGILYHAINHSFRGNILKMLGENDRLTLTDIHNRLCLDQSVASRHLSILRRAGFVKTIREGKSTYYELNYSQQAG